MKDTWLKIRISEDMMGQLRAISRKEGETVSNYVRVALESAMNSTENVPTKDNSGSNPRKTETKNVPTNRANVVAAKDTGVGTKEEEQPKKRSIWDDMGEL